MAISFNPKEVLTSIAKNVFVAHMIATGGSMQQATLLGETLQGALNGVSFQPEAKSIDQKLNSTITNVIKELFSAPDYIIPEECIEPIKEIFSIKNSINYLTSSNPLSQFQNAICKACSSAECCDLTTLPTNRIANDFLSKLYDAIYESPELSSVMLFSQAKEIQNKLDVLLQTQRPEDLFIALPAQAKQKSKESAEKYAMYFKSVLFYEHFTSDSLCLCDVYIDPCFKNRDGKNYANFDTLYETNRYENIILIEGKPGTGKSSLLMKIADRYLRGDIFPNKNVFFIKGKEIRYSNGNPITDILKALELDKVEALDNSIVFLDAYDEISYASVSSDMNQEYLTKLMYGCENFTLIITCRENYIKTFSGLRIQLLPFSSGQREKFLQLYNCRRSLSQNFVDALIKEDNEYEDKIYELLSIPMFLYMIAARQIGI